VDFQRKLKAKREKSSFGSKEGLMQIVASGLKSKELGFTISRGDVQRALMDYKLPDGSGLDVAERIRSMAGIH
jgi:DNA-binding response OmpR family regulator